MARWVMDATRGSTLAWAARRSMTSCWIRVESMSKTASLIGKDVGVAVEGVDADLVSENAGRRTSWMECAVSKSARSAWLRMLVNGTVEVKVMLRI